MAELLLFGSLSRTPAPVALPPDTLNLSDAEARARALDVQHSWIVEAPAGSGKTGLLIQRYLKLLALGGVNRPTDVLVLTFTRKADGELRDRVLTQLQAAEANAPLPAAAHPFERETRALALAVLARSRATGWHILDTPNQLNIRTIDSFCAEVAASTPLLAGGSAHRSPTDDAFPLYRAAAERTLAKLGGPDHRLSDALEHLLLHRDAQVGDCLTLIALMLAQREQWGELIPLRPEELDDQHLDTQIRPRLERTLARIVTAGLARAADTLGPENLNVLARIAVRLSTLCGYKANPNPVASCRSLPGTLPLSSDSLPQWTAALSLLLTKDFTWRKRLRASDLSVEAPKADQQELQQLIESLQSRESIHSELRAALKAVCFLPPPCYPDGQWPTVKALSQILAHALIELQGVFSARGQTDFTEIALAARGLLRPDPAQTGPLSYDPLDSASARLVHLLVDEMQDTSAGQYELLESLTESWDGGSQTIFLVGDPKQSIYAFRQARVERFLRTMETGRLGKLPLGALRLTANFRSQATLVNAFNATFEAVLPGPSDLSGDDVSSPDHTAIVPFVAAIPSRPATQSPALRWHASLKSSSQEQSGPDFASSRQARQIRELIESFLGSWPARTHIPNGQLRPPTVAVLARNRAHLAPILAELRGQNGLPPIPFRAVDVEALNDRPEVLDVLALTRALLHPADRVAWLAVLHSPLCGLGRADLLALTGDGPAPAADATVANLISGRLEYLSQEGQILLRRVWPTLHQAQATLGRTPLSTQVERTWRSLGGDLPLSPDRLTNALRFLDLLAKLEAGPEPFSLALLEQNLQKLYAQPLAGEAPVELMTIHKAKGLEWDLVLVPSLERGSGRNAHGLLKWLELDDPEEDEADFLLAPIQPKGEKSSELSNWLSKNEEKRAEAEAKRLFYVACTRAREELHLFATVEMSKEGSLCKPRNKDSLLKAAWPAAEPILAQQLLPKPPIEQPARDNVVPFPAAIPAANPETLALAASTDGSEAHPAPTAIVQRFPLDFNPELRFRRENGPGLGYPAASDLPRTAVFIRPEGSFAARAFGNAVHRFLELLSARLTTFQPKASLEAELPTWLARLTATLRNEGLAAGVAAGEAQRALDTLAGTLNDPEGAWLLSPHLHARTEASIGSITSSLRADRIFHAGPQPLDDSTGTHLWIVDYKTAELGGRSRASFLADQKAKYQPQMQAYAQAATAAGENASSIVLALYFPMLPALLHWPATEVHPLK